MSEDIYTSIYQPMQVFREQYKNMLFSHADERILPYVEQVWKQSGKQLRPALVLLSAIMSGDIQENTYKAAMLMEMIHGASIIHDDVVDNGMLRRGMPSINEHYGNQVAVLLGDYVLSHCMQMVTDNAYLIKLLAYVTHKMTEGELIQLQCKHTSIISEVDYYEIIRNKTAVLFSACMTGGVQSVAGDNAPLLSQWAEAGIHFGLMYQLCDDISDYYTKDDKKDNHKDIKEHKITLPLIAALQHCNAEEKEQLEQLYLHHEGTPEQIHTICSMVAQKGGLDYTLQAALQQKQQLEAFIHTYPNTEYSRTFMNIIRYVTDQVK